MIHWWWLTLWNYFCVIILPKFPYFQSNWSVLILHSFIESFILLCDLNRDLRRFLHIENIVKLFVWFWMNLKERIVIAVLVIAYSDDRKKLLKLCWREVKYTIISWLKTYSISKLRCPKRWCFRVHSRILCFSPWVTNFT